MNSGNGYGQNPKPHLNNILFPQMERKTIVGLIMFVALLAFEIFNFDTTRFALSNLLGDVRFLGLQWAGILAVAFCAIDFAGLARLFTPQKGKEEPQVVWYLMGAWLLGATMNAVMTWWAISLTLLSHDFGNEILSREQLLTTVPVFVATLVWLTRILFIGAFSVAGEHIFDLAGTADYGSTGRSAAAPVKVRGQSKKENGRAIPKPSRINRRPVGSNTTQQMPAPMQAKERRHR